MKETERVVQPYIGEKEGFDYKEGFGYISNSLDFLSDRQQRRMLNKKKKVKNKKL